MKARSAHSAGGAFWRFYAPCARFSGSALKKTNHIPLLWHSATIPVGLRPACLILAGLILWAWLIPFLPASAQAGQVRELRDSSGHQVRVKLPVRRIVVLNSDALEAVRILGAQDLVVGVYDRIPQAPRFWGDLAKLPVVGSWRDPDCEAIASLRPDLVLAYGYTPGPELNRRLEAMGIAVLRLDFYKLATLAKDMTRLGEVLGRESRAQKFIAWQERCLGALQVPIAQGKTKPRVYMEGYSTMQAVGPGSAGFAMCLAAGGEPISSSLSIPHPLISTEWLLKENPSVMVKVSNLMNSYDSPNPDGLRRIWQSMLARPGWHNLAAVKSGRVHVLAQDIWVGPGIIIGLAYLTKWFYPEICKDLQPRSWHQEYLASFQGLPLRGHFTYPDQE